MRAPRSLNDAVNCRFSNFRKTSAPVATESVREGSQDVLTTLPAIAASGMTIYTGDRFPAWQGNAFVGSLRMGGIEGARDGLVDVAAIGEHLVE